MIEVERIISVDQERRIVTGVIREPKSECNLRSILSTKAAKSKSSSISDVESKMTFSTLAGLMWILIIVNAINEIQPNPKQYFGYQPIPRT